MAFVRRLGPAMVLLEWGNDWHYASAAVSSIYCTILCGSACYFRRFVGGFIFFCGMFFISFLNSSRLGQQSKYAKCRCVGFSQQQTTKYSGMFAYDKRGVFAECVFDQNFRSFVYINHFDLYCVGNEIIRGLGSEKVVSLIKCILAGGEGGRVIEKKLLENKEKR